MEQAAVTYTFEDLDRVMGWRFVGHASGEGDDAAINALTRTGGRLAHRIERSLPGDPVQP